MNMHLPTFSDRVSGELEKTLIRLSVTTALLVASAFGAAYFALQVRSDNNFLKEIESHVTSLVETTNRPDLQRLLTSIRERKNSDILVIQNGIAIASSRSISDLDQEFIRPTVLKLIGDVELSSKSIVSEEKLSRSKGPENLGASIIMMTPILPIFISSIGIGAFILLIGLLLGRYVAGGLKRQLALEIEPVSELDRAIRALKNLDKENILKPQNIRELENIRSAILETNTALINAQDALASAKVKALLMDSYKRLIHDLHNPIRCLGNLVEATNAEKYGQDTAIEAQRKIPKIAQEILMQIEAAKSNLDFETPKFVEKDVRECIKDVAMTTEQSSLKKINLKLELPKTEVISAIDESLLKRAIGNLLNNAVDACQENILVRVQKQNSELNIQVMDDGKGIPEDAVAPYLQGRRKSTKADRQAIGLSAANHIIRSHGGRIIYKQAPLGGACFEVRI